MQQQIGNMQESPRVVSWQRFSLVDKARAGVAKYIDRLKATSLLPEGGRKYAEDQDHPIEVLSFHHLVSDGVLIILNDSSFWDKPSCWVSDFLFGCQSSCWEGIFLMSLLSGATLPAGLLISCLGVSLPVGNTFS